MYCNLDNIKDQLSIDEILPLVNDEKRAVADIDLTDKDDECLIRINDCIRKADNEIDSYLRSRYELPFAEVPEEIIDISVDLAIYNLYMRRKRLNMPESIDKNYKKRIQDLKELQKGTKLLKADGKTPDMSTDIEVNKRPEDRIFNNGLLDQF